MPWGVGFEDFQTMRACAVRSLLLMRISMEVSTARSWRVRSMPPCRLSITVSTLSHSVEEAAPNLPMSNGTRRRMRELRRRETLWEDCDLLIGPNSHFRKHGNASTTCRDAARTPSGYAGAQPWAAFLKTPSRFPNGLRREYARRFRFRQI